VWSAASRTHEVYLGSKSVAFVDLQGSSRWHDTQDVRQGLQVLEAAVRDKTVRARCRLWLSGALARPFVLEPVAGLRSRAEAQRAAEALASEATGLEGPCEVWTDEAFPRRKALAVAVQRATLEAIEGVAAQKPGLRVASVKPWWALGLRRVLGEDTGKNARVLLVEEPDALTLLRGEPGVFDDAATCWPVPEAEQARGWVRRNLLGARFEPQDAWRVAPAATQPAAAGEPVAIKLERLT